MTALRHATVAVAYVSENLVHTFESVAQRFDWSELFIGVIIVALVGNAAEHASAILFAFKNKLNVAVGSTLQVAHVRRAAARRLPDHGHRFFYIRLEHDELGPARYERLPSSSLLQRASSP